MWTSIKSLISDKKTKCIIIEDGMPKYVVLPFEEYQHLQQGRDNSTVSERSPVGRENSANEDLATYNRTPEGGQETTDTDYSSSINIEDLPF